MLAAIADAHGLQAQPACRDSAARSCLPRDVMSGAGARDDGRAAS